ncbi:hypothetical protein [Streptomyces sp. NPDC005828]|uniref:hypothetical protein n=1 Tax=Streptomyces sp. NPDC005828 TaxID=3157071 RepID=UPI003402AC7D
MARPSQYPLELRRRAVRMVTGVRPEYDTEWAGMKAVAQKFGIGMAETLIPNAVCRAARAVGGVSS